MLTIIIDIIVLILFDLENEISNRYERYAGISVGVSLGNAIYIDAVGKGFDGREISKGVCVHERYYIPWFEIRGLTIENFHKYNIYTIDQLDYIQTRNERIDYLLYLFRSLSSSVHRCLGYYHIH